ncbi:hypothetical protein BJV78DRAFT_1196075 [Lactifluus subvellereus]|nr:hypothetical protein BJV78DRAFT_1196075 [Lactifluus subvellereus]
MAILSELVDEESQDVVSLLNTLRIPSNFARHEIEQDKDAIAQLEEWKANALNALKDLHRLLQNKLDEVQKSDLIYTCATFQGDGDWTSEDIGALSSEILGLEGQPSLPLLEEVLMKHMKPIFQGNPHPMLNPETGRKLPRTAGGYAATQDAYEGQVWKVHPGIGNVLLWCVQQIDTDTYERLWYLIVPPVMTLLDDFEARYKLLGIRVVNAMLERAPLPLLNRTGVSELILASLHRALTFLHSPHTPAILRAAIPAAANLIERTTQPGSEQRFSQLCALLGDGVIGSVWMYSLEDADAVEASVNVLPVVVHALGIGTTRYLKALVPQLTHPLHPIPYKKPHMALQLSSLRALGVVIRECAPRIENWKGTIVEGLAKCWVVLWDGKKTDPDSEELRRTLRVVCATLCEVAPSVCNVVEVGRKSIRESR